MTCKKGAFEDKELAQLRLKDIQENSERRVKPKRCYKCDKCKMYHLTSKDA